MFSSLTANQTNSGVDAGVGGCGVVRAFRQDHPTGGDHGKHRVSDLLGTRRPSVNKVLKNLAHRHLIEVGYRTIGVLDRDGLQLISGR